mmetsp:Transcript_8182/g.24866  ORF Transcript_8182/g.24866 Transcript_8182/m.24866 type:complete len:203 (-) Transcript_8182:4-612(-)
MGAAFDGIIGDGGSAASNAQVLGPPRGEVVRRGKCNTHHPGNCQGVLARCYGYGDTYCQWHYIGVKTARRIGGHICNCPCSTANVMNQVQHCTGELARCCHCGDWYCDWHFEANAEMSKSRGGHVCKVTHNDMGVLSEFGRLNGLQQIMFNSSGWAPPARFADQVALGVELFERFSGAGCPPQRQRTTRTSRTTEWQTRWGK